MSGPIPNMLVDRFVCRRDGHRSAFTVTEAHPSVAQYFIAQCIRCGNSAYFNREGQEIPDPSLEPKRPVQA